MSRGEPIALFGHEEPACDESFRDVERVAPRIALRFRPVWELPEDDRALPSASRRRR